MSGLGKSRGASAVLGVAALLVGCQPLPHPFAEDRPPAALLRVRDGAGVSIAPIAGKPVIVADKLGAAMARALLKRDIPASDKTANLGSYQLYGRLVEAGDSTTMTVYWRLYDAKGRTVGERDAKVEASPDASAAVSDDSINRLAAKSADSLAPLLEDEAPVEATAGGRTRIAIGPISGAPGDGATSLATAIASVLRRQDLAIAKEGQPADLTVDGEVSVAPVGSGQQHVKILWRVRRADGSEIGTVGQENDVSRGMLDGPWGDIAYSVAVAAGDGLAQIVARAEPKS